MRKIVAGSVLAAFAAALSLVVFAAGDDGKGDLRAGGDGKLTFAVYGDSPYSQVSADYTKPAPYGVDSSEFDATPAFIDAINNDENVKLVVHVGDIHSGHEPCTLAYDASVYDLWTAFHDPLVYTPGDNEWTDCNKSGEAGNVKDTDGNYIDYANGDPVANLTLVRQLAFSQPGTTLGGGHMKVVSQAQAFDPDHPTDAEYVENVMWEQSKTVIVTVNLRGGSNNDADTWNGPAIEAEIAKREGTLELAKIDVDAEQTLAAQYGIQSIPTVAVFRDGKPVTGFVGAHPAAAIGRFLDDAITQTSEAAEAA